MWFVRRGKQILDELERDHNFLFLNYWFERYQNRYNISLRRKTHCSQKPPTALQPAIKIFHSKCHGVWAQSGQSCLGKRQATVQVTVFADRVDRVRPTVIFRGNSLRISAKEKQSYNRQVKVMYQEKAWCDQEIMK